MNSIFIISILCLGACSAYRRDWDWKDDSKCGENAVFKRCANPCPQTCLDDILRDNETPCDDSICKPGCDCKKGYVLNDVGECISLEDCEASCKLHSHFNLESCSNTCMHMFTGEPCEVEFENCECDEGFFLNTEGNCVANFDCTVEEVICPVNQTFYTCGSACPLTCENIYLEEDCDQVCTIGCDCYPGHVFNKDGVCVEVGDCLPEEHMCPSNKVYNACGNGNSRTCETLYGPLECYEECVPGCYCPEGLVFDAEQNLCIESYDCPNSLENLACERFDPNMYYYGALTGKVRTCWDLGKEMEDGECNTGCYCKDDMVLNWKNKCVPTEEC